MRPGGLNGRPAFIHLRIVIAHCMQFLTSYACKHEVFRIQR
jgi:hypothetical protein